MQRPVPADPTAVVGRRIAAAIVDGVLHFAVNAVVFFLLADRVGDGWQLRGGRALLYYLVSFGVAALHYGWLQGTRGFTLGKHAARIRVIGPDGAPRSYPGRLDETVVFLGCGDPDPHVPLSRVDDTESVLGGMGATVTKRIYPGLGHTVNQDEIEFVRRMMAGLLEFSL